jgi:hypothetical protein
MEDKYEEVVQWEVSHMPIEELKDFYMRTKKAYYEMYPASFKQFEDMYLKEQGITKDILDANEGEPQDSFEAITWTLNEVVRRYEGKDGTPSFNPNLSLEDEG